MGEDFNEYMKSFKEFSLKEKQSIVYEQLQMLASFTNSLCKELNIPNEILMNRELLDLKKDNYTEDDFAEAIIVLINSIQNSICDYSGGISDLLDKIENNNTEKISKDEQIAFAKQLLKLQDYKGELSIIDLSTMDSSIDAIYLSVPEKGGSSIIVDSNKEVLYANSSVSFDRHIKEYKNGRRTPLESFND